MSKQQYGVEHAFSNISLFPQDCCIHHFVEQQALMRSRAIALHDQEERISYSEVNQRANQFACYIRRLGLPSESIIGVLFERSANMIYAMLGILKAGHAFLPIDPDYPKERVNYVLQDSQCPLLITLSKHLAIVTEQMDDVLLVDEIQDQLDDLPHSNLNLSLTSRHLAFIIYTSGSTGRPKGVLHEHRSICNLNQAKRQTCYVHEKSVLLQSASIGFDAAVWEWTSALMGGSRLVLESNENILPGMALIETLRRHKVTILSMCPTALSQLPVARVDSLQVIMSAGEACYSDLVEKWAGLYTFINGYGPSECCVASTMYICSLRDVNTSISIGTAIANTFTYVLDENMNPVEPGEKGELYIGGCGVARGYLNRPDQTKERFLDNPFIEFESDYTKMYRTGDLVREREDGNLEYLGRVDHQVKLRGFRIELEGVENVLMLYPNVKQALCQIEKNNLGEEQLTATMTIQGDTEISLNDFRGFLCDHIMEQSIPSVFYRVDAFSVTANGKANRDSVTQLDRVKLEHSSDVRPLSDLECRLLPLWKKALGVDVVCVDTPFYYQGGNSLVVPRVVQLINQACNSNITTGEFLQHSSIKEIAALLEGKNTRIDFSKETVLPEDIHPVKKNAVNDKPRTILLTGASGFLGAHLLSDLCAMTDARIICLVRADSVLEAKQKLQINLARYDFDKLLFGQRIEILLSDLSQPKFGLPDGEFQRLCEDVDSIYHNGAFVHHLYNYQTLRSVNVDSTLDMLRLATTHHNKSFFFISTSSATTTLDSEGYLSEELPTTVDHPPTGGYPQSKWVSERLLQQACSRGIHIKVFRPSAIMGQSLTGICSPENNHLFSLIKGCLQLQYAPDWDMPLNLLPVDFVSLSIVLLSQQYGNTHNAFNIVNQQILNWRDLMEWVNLHCGPVEILPEDEWRRDKLPLVTEENALYRLLPDYQQSKVTPSENVSLAAEKFRFNRTQSVLEDYGLAYPTIGTAQLKCYFDYLKKSGFIRLS